MKKGLALRFVGRLERREPGRKRFGDLTEQEVLALAISSEEDDARIYRWYAEALRAEYPASAAAFDDMAAEEDEHRRRLIDLHTRRFGEAIPLVRREHVAGYYARRPVWLVERLGVDRIRAEAARMEREAGAFYTRAAQDTIIADRDFYCTEGSMVGVATR